MAKITIAEKAVVITSALTLADLKKVKKYHPEALVLTEGENKEPVFSIGIAETGNGSIGTYGASFAPSTVNADGKAAITMTVNGEADVEKYVIDKYAAAIINLNKLEEKIPAVLNGIASDEAAVKSAITVVGATTAAE